MDALIRQADKRVRLEMASKPETRKNAWWKRRGKERKTKQQQHFLIRKRRQDMSASNGTKAGYT